MAEAEKLLGFIEDCPVHGVLHFDGATHAAIERRERTVANAAMESNVKMAGVDFHPGLLCLAPGARKVPNTRAAPR